LSSVSIVTAASRASIYMFIRHEGGTRRSAAFKNAKQKNTNTNTNTPARTYVGAFGHTTITMPMWA